MRLTQPQLDRAQQYARLFNTDDGKAVLDDIRKAYDKQTFCGDPYETAFSCGQREVYLRILRILEIAKDPRTAVEDEEPEEA